MELAWPAARWRWLDSQTLMFCFSKVDLTQYTLQDNVWHHALLVDKASRVSINLDVAIQLRGTFSKSAYYWRLATIGKHPQLLWNRVSPPHPPPHMENIHRFVAFWE